MYQLLGLQFKILECLCQASFGQIILEYWFQLLEVLIKLSDGWDIFHNSVAFYGGYYLQDKN